MKRVVLTTIILVLGTDAARAVPQAAQCSSFYISEITLVSTADGEAGHVQTFVGFWSLQGRGREECPGMVLAYQIRS